MTHTLLSFCEETAQKVRAFAAAHPVSPLSPPELEAAACAYFARGGKFLRPTAVRLTAELFGTPEAGARATALGVACEWFHLFTLIHDDVIDHDDTRRGGPSAHVLAASQSGISSDNAAGYGRSVAILAGDALHGRALSCIASAELPAPARLFLMERLVGHTLPNLLSGEALDTKLALTDTLPNEEELFSVYEQKTGELFSFAFLCGATAAHEAPPPESLQQTLDELARRAGINFQLADDYLGLVKTEAQMGKSALSDIREGKRTFFVLCALKHASAQEKEQLLQTLGNPNASQERVKQARDLLLQYGKEPYSKRLKENESHIQTLLARLPDNEKKPLFAEFLSALANREK